VACRSSSIPTGWALTQHTFLKPKAARLRCDTLHCGSTSCLLSKYRWKNYRYMQKTNVFPRKFVIEGLFSCLCPKRKTSLYRVFIVREVLYGRLFCVHCQLEGSGTGPMTSKWRGFPKISLCGSSLDRGFTVLRIIFFSNNVRGKILHRDLDLQTINAVTRYFRDR
jgi:hypothetical protein